MKKEKEIIIEGELCKKISSLGYNPDVREYVIEVERPNGRKAKVIRGRFWRPLLIPGGQGIGQ